MSWFSDQFSKDIFEKKYKGDAPDVFGYFRRLAKLVSRGDNDKEEKFYNMMIGKRFSPGGRILAFGGRPTAKVSLMNCTTHKILDDSLESINDAAMTIMRASSRGQGIGIDLSFLRPKDAPVNNAAKTSTGAISFMEMLNHVAGTIGQEGRRAALLFSLSVDHPDLYRPEDKTVLCHKCEGRGCAFCNEGYLPYDFIHVKRIPGKVENANISVRITDEFMRAVQFDLPWTLRYKGTSDNKDFSVERTYPAREIFHALAKSAWASAEPGILYWDTSKKFSNSDRFGEQWKIVGLNACTEEVLDQDGVCNLGSLNLAAYVVNPFTKDASFNYQQFESDVYLAVEFLDNVIDIELEKGTHTNHTQMQSLRNLRRIGLGVMGLADMLAMLGLSYSIHKDPGTEQFLRHVFSKLVTLAYSASTSLAKNRGPAEVWNNANKFAVVNGGFFSQLPRSIQSMIESYGTRNVVLLSIAPTGTISNLFGVTGGIEPLFAKEFIRRTRMNGSDQFINYVHTGVKLAREVTGNDSVYQTAYDLSVSDHLDMQALVQEYVDASIAKTLNFPASATILDVEQAYMQGWKLGLKGMAIYVDGSRDEQVLYKQEKEEEQTCDACGSNEVTHKEGCTSCETCGWSLCSL